MFDRFTGGSVKGQGFTLAEVKQLLLGEPAEPESFEGAVLVAQLQVGGWFLSNPAALAVFDFPFKEDTEKPLFSVVSKKPCCF